MRVERHNLGCGTTWHSAADFSRLATSASYIRFLGYSREVHQAVEAETGLSVGWRQTGRVQIEVVLAAVGVTSGDGAHQIDAAVELVELENCVPSRHLEAPA